MDLTKRRQMIIGGNWKCNGTVKFLNDFTFEVLNKAEFDNTKVQVVIAPITMHLASLKALVKEDIKVACQNIGAQGCGAFTGEVSGE